MAATFGGDITIDSLKARDANGNLSGSTFANVLVGEDQVIAGTTTLFSAFICVAVYHEGQLPDRYKMRAAAPAPDPDPPPVVESALYEDTLLSSESAGTAVPWCTLLPKNTLSSGQTYVIVAHDTDDLAITTQSFQTT